MSMRVATPSTSLIALMLVAWVMTLTGCGGGGTGSGIPMPADPKAASQTELEATFTQLTTQLAKVKPGSDRAVNTNRELQLVGGELAQRAAATVRTRLSQIPRVDGKLPEAALEAEIGGLESVRRWNEQVHDTLRNELDDELESTQREMSSLERDLQATGADDVVARVELLSQLANLAGEGSMKQSRFASERDGLMQSVSQQAEQAIANEDYEKAQSLLGIVQEVNPEDRTARQQKCEVDGKVIIKRFNAALETGRVSRTVEMLTELSESDCFGDIKASLASDAAPMAQAFAQMGQESAASGDLAGAYQAYRDAGVISKLLLDQKPNLPGIASFLSRVDTQYEKAFDAGEFGVAWGFLGVLTEFGPTTPKIRQRLRRTRDEISRRAVRGLTAYPFEDPKTSPTKVGDAVSSKVVQHIFKTIPSDVSIVEREQLERILEECKRKDACSALDTADFIVQGTILDAKVETTEKSGRETRRVVTGREKVPNPEHVNWMAMREKDRKKITEPKPVISRDITEDVSIEVTSVRKVGIISVAYRVVEASSGRVLFTDSIQTKQEFQDEGREGVQLGNFTQETDFVELPPDIEILSGDKGLADKISEQIGVKLVDFLKNPEEQYVKEAERFVNEGDFIGAARKAAYAIVLNENKQKDVGPLQSDLRRYAMSSPSL